MAAPALRGGTGGGAASGQEESDRGAAGPEGSSTPDEDARSTAIGASAQLSASARGGRELLLAAYLVRSGVWITAGGESTSGAGVPERRGVVLGGELELGDDAAVQLEARAVPAQEQMSRTAGEALMGPALYFQRSVPPARSRA